jgi:hypothetical protein
MTKGTAFEVELLKGMNVSQDAIDAHIYDSTPIMKLIPLTTDEIREQGRDYNPREWDKNIDSLLKYSDIKFYKRDRNESPKQYDEYFAVFTNRLGVRKLQSVSYSASLNNTPWVEVDIDEDNILHYIRRSIRFKRNDTAMDYLVEQSRTYGRIYTTQF